MSDNGYSQELGDKICAQISEGRSLSSVCRELGIHRQRVFEWLRVHESFLTQYTIAKEESADALAEEMLDIADDRNDDPQSRRVRVDTRKWIASKMKPKKYGDKVDLNANINGQLNLSGKVVFVDAKDEK